MYLNKRYENILLFSGGIDSYIGWYYLNKPQTVYFDVGSRYSEKEKLVIKNLIPSTIIDNSIFLGDVEQEDNAFIPYRNLLLASIASARYSDNVWICGLKDDKVEDKNKEIFELWSNHLTELNKGKQVSIKSPFWGMTKVDIVKWFDKHYHSKRNILTSTVSCYSSGIEPYCGICKACFRKAAALYSIGIKLPFYNINLVKQYFKLFSNSNYYDENRSIESIKYCNYLMREY